MNRIRILAKRIPTARLMAMGIMNWAVVLVSNIRGIKPRDVVIVVRKMGRKRLWVARTTASSTV